MKKVLVAMSGGVDSSTAAFLLKKQGYEVAGATMKLWRGKGGASKPGERRLLDDVREAKRVCDFLGIRHYTFNLEKDFKKCVVDNFVYEYLSGRTPNPCIVCNERIKFGLLMQRAKELGFDYLSTGHYAVIEKRGKEYFLKKGADTRKDQSYVLYNLGQGELSRLLFPIGKMKKEKVRELARKGRLPVARRPESQEICFIKGSYPDFLRSYVRGFGGIMERGRITDTSGRTLGFHKGFPFYTIGQRSGLGLSSAVPLYVRRIDPHKNRLLVGTREEASSAMCSVKRVSWVSGRRPKLPMRCEVKIRYLHRPSKAKIGTAKKGVKIFFSEPQFAVTPGQSAVFYSGDVVLGGGVIRE
ncbi:MAG: tRNA 2-thiouridine(34) synthase MnmA [Endomicrobiales bacterium]|nr:tRNA 2-thiouridine(34) synthase MnmA [Endomicrobiales bacterium]